MRAFLLNSIQVSFFAKIEKLRILLHDLPIKLQRTSTTEFTELMTTPSYSLRKATTQDIHKLMSCFEAAILLIDVAIYSQAQREAWVKKGYENHEKWIDRIERQYFIIAESENQIAGFISVSYEGYVDLLFTNPDFQRKGIAHALYNHTENHLKAKGVNQFETHASAISRFFFEKKGFTLQKEQHLELYGVPISNFHMVKAFN